MNTPSATTRVAVFEYDEDERMWLVHDADEPRCHTYGRTASKAEAAIVEAMAAWHDVGPDELELDTRWVLGTRAAESVDAFFSAKDAEADARVRAHESALRAVDQLTDAGLSTRDAGTVLGFSHQRIAQLRDELATRSRRARRKETA